MLKELSEEERTLMFNTPEAKDQKIWRSLISRSNLYALADFLEHRRNELIELPLFMQEVAENIDHVISASDWYSLNTSLSIIDKIDDKEITILLRAACAQKAIKTDLAKENLKLAVDAVNALLYIQKVDPAKLSELGDLIADIVPSTNKWLDACRENDNPITLYRLLLGLCRHPSITDRYAHRVLGDARHLLPQMVEEEDPSTVYLFLWNWYALWVERRPISGAHFWSRLGPDLFEKLIGRIGQAASKRLSNEAKVAWLGLGGAIDLLDPAKHERLIFALRRRLKGGRFLLEIAETLTFLPRYLSFRGLCFVMPAHFVFTPTRCQALLDAAEAYEFVGPAIESLKNDVRKRINRY